MKKVNRFFCLVSIALTIAFLGAVNIRAVQLQPNPIDSLLLYYGYPSAVSGNKNDLAQSAVVFASYQHVVLGAGIEEDIHSDHQNTTKIIEQTKRINPNVKFYGYIATGNREGLDACLSNDEFAEKVEKWKAIGAAGIFLDEFDYSYFLTRTRQNDFINIVHANSLNVIMNGYYIDDVFSTAKITKSVKVREFTVTASEASGVKRKTEITVSDTTPFRVGDTIKLVNQDGSTIVDTTYHRKHFEIKKVDSEKGTITVDRYVNSSFDQAVIYLGSDGQTKVKNEANNDQVALVAKQDDIYLFEDPFFDDEGGQMHVKPPTQLKEIYNYYFRPNDGLQNQTYNEFYQIKTATLNKVDMNLDRMDEYQEIVDLCNLLSIGLNIDIYGIMVPSSQYPIVYQANALDSYPELIGYEQQLLYPVQIDQNQYSNSFYTITWNVLDKKMVYSKNCIEISEQ